MPDGFPVGFRILLREWVPEGIDLDEAIGWAKVLEKEGIAYLSPSAGTYNSIFRDDIKRRMARKAYLIEDVRRLTGNVGIPTILSGRLTTPAMAEDLLEEGIAPLIGLGRPLRVDPKWLVKARLGERITPCTNCNWCLRRVALEKGFSCALWPQILQERVDLNHSLLDRNYRGLSVISTTRDLETLKAALPEYLPVPGGGPVTIDPTALFFLKTDPENPPADLREDFLAWGRSVLERSGFHGAHFRFLERPWQADCREEVSAVTQGGNHGIVLIVRDRNEPWREHIPYRLQHKVVGLLGSNANRTRVLVPLDLSPTTLLVMLFLRQSWMAKPGFTFDFVHVITRSAGHETRQWEHFKRVLDWHNGYTLKMIPVENGVARSLLGLINKEGYGTIIMGKRGLSGIKRWLLGSVSSKILKGLEDQTLFLID